MLSFPANVRLFLADTAVDFRKGFDGLAGLVEHQFGLEPMSGDVFIFLNRRANQVRLLFWDRDGFCLVAKRLERGTFRRAKRAVVGQAHVEVDVAELVLLLEGIDVPSMRRRKRYVRVKKCAEKAENIAA